VRAPRTFDLPTLGIIGAAAILVAGPILLGLQGIAALAAVTLGALGIGLGVKTLLRPERWSSRLMVDGGLASALTPWIAGFAATDIATALFVIVGAAFAGRAFWLIEQTGSEPRSH
jgi:hypothetical protein